MKEVVIIIPFALAALGVVVVLLRGGRIKGPGGFFLETPGPEKKILRERNGSRIYIEAELLETYADKLGALDAEIRTAKIGSMTRALDYAEGRLIDLLFMAEEYLDKVIHDRNSPWYNATTSVAKCVCHDLVRTTLRDSYVNNGFYKYKIVTSEGGVIDSVEWSDFVKERTETIYNRIRSEVKRLYSTDLSISDQLNDMFRDEFKTAVVDAVGAIYEKFWNIQRDEKLAVADLRKQKAVIHSKIKEGVSD